MRSRKLLKRIGASGVAAAGLAGTAAGRRVQAHVETDDGTEIVPVAELIERWDDPAAEFERRGIDVGSADLTQQCEETCCKSCINCLCCFC